MVRRYLMLLTAISLVILVATTAVMWIYNDRIMSANAPKLMKLIVSAFFRPPDLYALIVRSDINLSQAGIKEGIFKTKYSGRHGAGILLRNFDADKLYFDRYRSPLRLKITFLRGSIPIISKIVGESMSPFMGKESGFYFLIFNVPENFIVGETITYRVEVVSPDAAFNDIYGPAEFFVRKFSDK